MPVPLHQIIYWLNAGPEYRRLTVACPRLFLFLILLLTLIKAEMNLVWGVPLSLFASFVEIFAYL